MASENSYPRTINASGKLVELHKLTSDDIDAIVAFAKALPEKDLQFLRIDITDRAVVERWIESVDGGVRKTVVAKVQDEVVGYGSLNRRELAWMRHLGEIRVIVAPELRKHGLGGILAHEVFEIAKEMGLTKLVAQMAREQKGARKLFHDLGFSVEALLADWIIDRSGETRDLLLMSHDVTGLGG